MKLIPTALYLGDNGRCFCGSHAGATAQASGCDLSGQPVHRLTDADREYLSKSGAALACEQCSALYAHSHSTERQSVKARR